MHMKVWQFLLAIFAFIAIAGAYMIHTSFPTFSILPQTPPPTIYVPTRPEIAPGLPLAQTVVSTSTASSTPVGSTKIVPNSIADPIVGDNLMLGIDINTKLGHYLLGYTGKTLYTFSKDNIGTSTCYYDCTQVWIPYIISPSDRYNLQYGVDATKVGFITRADGELQLTYGGKPLYFYSGDKTSDDFTGQGYHGAWYVVNP